MKNVLVLRRGAARYDPQLLPSGNHLDWNIIDGCAWHFLEECGRYSSQKCSKNVWLSSPRYSLAHEQNLSFEHGRFETHYATLPRCRAVSSFLRVFSCTFLRS